MQKKYAIYKITNTCHFYYIKQIICIILKRKGRRTELWETPCKSSGQELELSQNFAFCNLSER